MSLSTQHSALSTRIKICGIRDTAGAFAAAEAGADMIGFVFAPSKRRIEPEQAAAVISELRAAYGARAPLAIGLFVNEAAERMREIAGHCGLDMVQLSGDEAPDADLLAAIERPVVRVLRVPAGTRVAEVVEEASRWHAAAAEIGRQSEPVLGVWGSRVLIGLDAYHPGVYGGTGQAADHTLAASLAAAFPLMLAGGLRPGNVAAAIAGVKPWAVDVSSGVEEQGAKSPALIGAFVAAARAAVH